MDQPIAFEPSTDLHLVREILTDPRCWRRMTDDEAPDVEAFHPEPRPGLEYVVAREDGRAVALFLLLDRVSFAEVHFCFRPEAWGRSEAIALAFVAWVWRETPHRWLVGPVPEHNRLALKLAKMCGFTAFGRETRAVRRRGKMYDRILLEARRPEPNYRREAGALHEPQSTSRTLSPRT